MSILHNRSDPALTGSDQTAAAEHERAWANKPRPGRLRARRRSCRQVQLRPLAELEQLLPGLSARMNEVRLWLESQGRSVAPAWGEDLTQKAALLLAIQLDPAARVPTHYELQGLRLFGLAQRMSAADLDRHAAELGIERTFCERRKGTWTLEYAASLYADLAKELGTVPSSAMLVRAGGDAAQIYQTANKSPG